MVVEPPPAIDETAEGSTSTFGVRRAELGCGRKPYAPANTAIAATTAASTSPRRHMRGEAFRVLFDCMMTLI